MLYLDCNATTPPLPAVADAVRDALLNTWANSASQHVPGQQARRVLAAARATVAQILGCLPAEVVFTSGATESNHLALRGLLAAAGGPLRRRVVMGAAEHASHLQMAQWLQAQGVPVDFMPFGGDGALDVAAACALIRPDVAVVSLMAAQNETGACMPVAALAQAARRAGAAMHVDATQWLGKLPFHFGQWDVDAVSLSAHKFHGPKGIGALLLRQGVAWTPQTAGSQERGRRGGTENLPGIVGMAAALQALGDVAAEATRQAGLRDALESGLQRALPPTRVWAQRVPRLPNTSLLRFGLLHADVVLQRLDQLGVAASPGAACTSGGGAPSAVLRAMGVPRDEALCAVRFSLGRTTTSEDIQQFLHALPPLLAPLLQHAAVPA